MNPWLPVLAVLSLSLAEGAAAAPPLPTAPHCLEIHLFGGDMAAGAPLANWYRDIGLTNLRAGATSAPGCGPEAWLAQPPPP